jgi:hypothetical protein
MLDRDGSRIGTIDAIYLDDHTGQPEWGPGQHRPVRHQVQLRPPCPGHPDRR